MSKAKFVSYHKLQSIYSMNKFDIIVSFLIAVMPIRLDQIEPRMLMDPLNIIVEGYVFYSSDIINN